MITTGCGQSDTPEIGAPPPILLAPSLSFALVERKKPGRRSKGDRTQVNTRQPRVLADAAEAEAARRGLTLTDYIGQLLAGDLGIPYEVQEGLPLAKSA